MWRRRVERIWIQTCNRVYAEFYCFVTVIYLVGVVAGAFRDKWTTKTKLRIPPRLLNETHFFLAFCLTFATIHECNSDLAIPIQLKRFELRKKRVQDGITIVDYVHMFDVQLRKLHAFWIERTEKRENEQQNGFSHFYISQTKILGKRFAIRMHTVTTHTRIQCMSYTHMHTWNRTTEM